jgi:hypothetical protein
LPEAKEPIVTRLVNKLVLGGRQSAWQAAAGGA